MNDSSEDNHIIDYERLQLVDKKRKSISVSFICHLRFEFTVTVDVLYMDIRDQLLTKVDFSKTMLYHTNLYKLLYSLLNKSEKGEMTFAKQIQGPHAKLSIYSRCVTQYHQYLLRNDNHMGQGIQEWTK